MSEQHIPGWVEEDGVLVEFLDVGEVDMNETPMYRFYVSRLVDGDWKDVDDASYCTLVPIDTPDEVVDKLAAYIMQQVGERVRNGDSIKKLCERLSWINTSWIKVSDIGQG